METIVARGIQALLALSGAYLIALWFVLVVWTYRDVEARSRSVITQIFSTLLVVLFYIPGVLLYMILRPKETLDAAFQRSLEEEYLLQDLEELPLCHSCHRYVEDDFVLCPHCHTTLRDGCASCGRLVHLRWSLCPYCGAEQSERAALPEKVEAPAARWRSTKGPRRRPEPTVVPRPAMIGQPAVAASVVTELERPAAAERIERVEERPAAISILRPANGASSVRLFDRRKTRAAAMQQAATNGREDGAGSFIRSLVNGNGRALFEGTNGNGHAKVNGNGHSPNGRTGQNGHHPEPAADEPVEAREVVAARGQSRD